MQGQPGPQHGTISVHVTPSNEFHTQFPVHGPELLLDELPELPDP